MKRIVLLLSFAVPGLAALYFAAPAYVASRKAADESAAYARRLAAAGPLVLDAQTQAISAGADRVETFRLMNPNQDGDEKYPLPPSKPLAQPLENCTVLRVGSVQGPAFAVALRAALSQMPSPVGLMAAGQHPSPDDFGSDVGFRVWKGKAHADVYVGLYTRIGEVISQDAHHKTLTQAVTALDASRPAFIALSKQAFPEDKQLAAVE